MPFGGRGLNPRTRRVRSRTRRRGRKKEEEKRRSSSEQPSLQRAVSPSAAASSGSHLCGPISAHFFLPSTHSASRPGKRRPTKRGRWTGRAPVDRERSMRMQEVPNHRQDKKEIFAVLLRLITVLEEVFQYLRALHRELATSKNVSRLH